MAMSDTLLLLLQLLLPISRRLSLALALTLPWAYAQADTHEVTFSLYAPQAKSVEVIGDFNQWLSGVPLLADPDEKGMWHVKLALPATLTRIEYVYRVDGSYRQIDPRRPIVRDGFSGENNVLMLP